jgi:predicted Zn-dependent protease with MMP-like domain
MLCGGFTPGETLLGYYQGIPLTERGIDYGMGEVLPDRVTVYKKANSG